MKTEDYNYELPEELIAQIPLEKRSESKLLILNKQNGDITHHTFKDIINGRPSQQKIVAVSKDKNVSEAVALMKDFDIENIPVFDGENLIGSISESGLFQKIFSQYPFLFQLIHNPL